MNNQICNCKKEVSTGIQFNDKDYMNNLLSSLKDMIKNYTIALTEASNENLYNKYKKVFDEVTNLQRQTYEIMFRNGWYILEQAEEMKVNNKYNTLLKEYQDLGVQ